MKWISKHEGTDTFCIQPQILLGMMRLLSSMADLFVVLGWVKMESILPPLGMINELAYGISSLSLSWLPGRLILLNCLRHRLNRRRRELAKKPTSIEFTRHGDILVSDKFGDVFRWTIHESPSSGKLILGHASLLTSFLLTPDEQFIVTADRDEHIRVSWYPEGYVIEAYCLGHKK